jgi:protein-S-isoprenylcysteine O-methyltransferase Ste14
LIVDRVIIPREEAHLAASFGEEYERYRGRARRWL